MAQPLPVPFYKQQAVGYCLPACAQMVLAYQGISHSQDELARESNLKPGLGTPTRNIQRLASPEIKVVYEEGTLEQVQTWLGMGIPVIAFVQAGELSYWQDESFQHAVVIIGLEKDMAWLLDPDTNGNPIAIPTNELMLAWSGMDYLYAVLLKNL